MKKIRKSKISVTIREIPFASCDAQDLSAESDLTLCPVGNGGI